MFGQGRSLAIRFRTARFYCLVPELKRPQPQHPPQKAPDYSFRIGGVRKFFVETKKPSLKLKDDPSPAFQLRRYTWSAKLPLSILTDFEEFAVYNCRVRPDKNDKASKERTLYIRHEEYADRWDEMRKNLARPHRHRASDRRDRPSDRPARLRTLRPY